MFKELNTTADLAARRLLGCELVREIDGEILRVKIVETESYDQSDPASHTFRGPTPRNKAMFGPSGLMYVYFIYGMHYCANVVTGQEGYGSGALIRAGEPIEGIEFMKLNRPNHESYTLTNGPSKLCYALKIGKEFNEHDLSMPPMQLVMKPELPKEQIHVTTRIGIKEAKEELKRFYIKDNPYVSIK